jgi:hypothetical protein
METPEQIEARLRQQFPVVTERVNGVDAALGPAAYEAKIAEWVANELAAQQAAADEEARRELRRQVRIARTRLQQIRDATGAFSNAQRDAAIKDVARILDGLIGVVVDLALIERE